MLTSFTRCLKMCIYLFSLISYVYAQKDDSYIIKLNGDTLNSAYIVKINTEQNIIRIRDITGYTTRDVSLDSVSSFYYQNATWELVETMQELQNNKEKDKFHSSTSNLFDLLSKKKEVKNYHPIFLPQVKENKSFHLGTWGALFGTKTETKVNVKCKGDIVLYEYVYIFNSGNTMGSNTMLYLYSDSLGICKLYFEDKKNPSTELEAEMKRRLLAYTTDRADLTAQLDDPAFKYDYKHINKYVKAYFKK